MKTKDSKQTEKPKPKSEHIRLHYSNCGKNTCPSHAQAVWKNIPLSNYERFPVLCLYSSNSVIYQAEMFSAALYTMGCLLNGETARMNYQVANAICIAYGFVYNFKHIEKNTKEVQNSPQTYTQISCLLTLFANSTPESTSLNAAHPLN